MTDIVAEIPSIGHNQPPLSELLIEETSELEVRAGDLISAAGRAVVTDEDTAKKAVKLIAMIKEHAERIEGAREERKRPYLESGRLVDKHYALLRTPLVGENPKVKLGGAAAKVDALVDAYRRRKEAEAAAERRRLEEEARRQREAAEAAARAQREAEERERVAAEEAARKIREAEIAAAQAANKAQAAKRAKEIAEARAAQEKEAAAARERKLQAEIEEGRRREEAARLERQAAETVAAPIVTDVGAKAHRRVVFTTEITDLTVAIRHARKVDEASVRDAVQKIYDRQVRAGVRELPGANVIEDSTTRYRR